MDGDDFSSLRVGKNDGRIFLWNDATQTFDVEFSQGVDDAAGIASLSADDFVALLKPSGDVSRYTTADGWTPVDTSGLPQNAAFGSVFGEGAVVWGGVDTTGDGDNDAVARLGRDGWEVFPGPLMDSEITSVDVVDGVAWFIQEQAVVRVEPTTP